MATHRVSFEHVTHGPDTERRDAQVTRSRPGPDLGLFLLAPLSLALTVFAVCWISKMSF